MANEFPQRVKIIKTDGQYELPFPTGLEIVGWEPEKPEVGRRYRLLQDNGSSFSTGAVLSIDEGGFETANSRYKLVQLRSEEQKDDGELKDTIDLSCEPRKVMIRCVDGSVIEGHVNLKNKNRVSDLFTTGEEPFIVVFDAQVKGSPPGRTLVVNKYSISWVSIEE